MSRRDTIIIAVLVNAGLLMVLFATAMRSDKKEEKKAVTTLAETPPLQEQTAPLSSETITQTTAENLVDSFAEATPSDPSLESLFDSAEIAAGEEVEIAITPSKVETLAPTPQVAVQETPKQEVVKQEVKVPASQVTVTVKKGDFLEKIAKANHTTVTGIMKANNLSTTNLKIGQVLRMPKEGEVAKKETTASKSTTTVKKEIASVGQEYYTVKEGDNPWLIATRNHVKLDELLRLNGMDEQKARRLRPGDKLRIR